MQSSTTSEIQRLLFQKIKEQVGDKNNFVYEIAEALQIGHDSAYRRIRGDKLLSIEELFALSRIFKISIDSFMGQQHSAVNFQYQKLQSGADFEGHLQRLAGMLKTLSTVPGSRIVYGAADVPIFNHFQKPEHTAFKLFYWQQAVLGVPELMGKKFSPEHIEPKAMELASEIYQMYLKTPTIEIWTEESVITTIRQIGYYFEAGLFESVALAKEVTSQYLDLLRVVRRQAEKNFKDSANQIEYQLYESEIQIGNNCVLADINGTKIVYLRHQTFNTMHTMDPVFCQDTEQFLDSLIRRSTLISGISEKQRHNFFQRLEAPIIAMLDKIR